MPPWGLAGLLSRSMRRPAQRLREEIGAQNRACRPPETSAPSGSGAASGGQKMKERRSRLEEDDTIPRVHEGSQGRMQPLRSHRASPESHLRDRASDRGRFAGGGQSPRATPASRAEKASRALRPGPGRNQPARVGSGAPSDKSITSEPTGDCPRRCNHGLGRQAKDAIATVAQLLGARPEETSSARVPGGQTGPGKQPSKKRENGTQEPRNQVFIRNVVHRHKLQGKNSRLAFPV